MTYFKTKMTFDSHKTPSEHIMIHHILEYIPIYGKCTIKFPAIFLCCDINVRFLCITTKVQKMFHSETSATYTRNNLKSKLYSVERSSKLTSKISVCMCVIEMYKLYMDFGAASLITFSLSMPSCLVCVWGGGGGGAEGFTE